MSDPTWLYVLSGLFILGGAIWVYLGARLDRKNRQLWAKLLKDLEEIRR